LTRVIEGTGKGIIKNWKGNMEKYDLFCITPENRSYKDTTQYKDFFPKLIIDWLPQRVIITAIPLHTSTPGAMGKAYVR
jgi:hypothetical protein